MASPEDVERFISSSFRSVWSLELLLLLKRQPGFHSRVALIGQMRGSELVVSQALESLVAGGLASLDQSGRAAFFPMTPDLSRLVDGAEELYLRKPDAVRRLIVAGAAPGLAAFADAFRLRRD